MFSFSDYVRRLTRDAALAGFYDALEIVEAHSGHDPGQAAELLVAKLDGPPDTPAPPPPAQPPPQPARLTPPQPQPARPPLPAPNYPPPAAALEPRKRGRPPKHPEGQP
jgi:hypothetical protein